MEWFNAKLASLALLAFLLIRYGIGSGWSVVVGVRFRLIHCNLNFGGRCLAVGAVSNSLPCIIRIGRLGFLEYRTIRYFVCWMLPSMGRVVLGFFLEHLWLDILRVPFRLDLTY